MLVPDSKLVSPDILCRKQLLFRGAGGGQGKRKNILLEQFYFRPFVKDVVIGVTSKNRNRRTRDRVEGTGNVDLLML